MISMFLSCCFLFFRFPITFPVFPNPIGSMVLVYMLTFGVYCWDPCRVSRRFCALEIRRRIGGDQLVEMPWKVEVLFMGIYRDIYGNYGELWEIYGNIWWWKIASGNLLQFANLKITIESSLTYTLNMVIFHSFFVCLPKGIYTNKNTAISPLHFQKMVGTSTKFMVKCLLLAAPLWPHLGLFENRASIILQTSQCTDDGNFM